MRPIAVLECRSCGAGAPLHEHFCPQCSRVLALGRHGDYFSFVGLPRQLVIDGGELERRFRDLSRKFHPDYYHNATPVERMASLERSSYLNDAYRALKNPISRIEHLLAVEGLPLGKPEDQKSAVPPSLLEEVFALNEELDEIREAREAGDDPAGLRARVADARQPIDRKKTEHEAALAALCQQWDAAAAAGDAGARPRLLAALRERLLERNYVNNLLSAIERELGQLGAAGGEGRG